VRSYRTLSPLPPAYRGRSTLCGTFPRVTAAGRYPACRLSWSPDLPLKPTFQRTPASSSRHQDTIEPAYLTGFLREGWWWSERIRSGFSWGRQRR